MVSPLNTCTATLAGTLSASVLPLWSVCVCVCVCVEGDKQEDVCMWETITKITRVIFKTKLLRETGHAQQLYVEYIF